MNPTCWQVAGLSVVLLAGGAPPVGAQVVLPVPVATTPAADPDSRLEASRDVWRHVRFDERRDVPPGRRHLLAEVVGDFGRFFASRENYTMLAVGLGGALGASRLDQPIARSSFNESVNGPSSDWVNGVFEAGEVLGGGAMQFAAALSTYGAGAWLDKPQLEGLGRDLLRAQLLAQGVTHAVKRSVQRTRPDGSTATSFPSGHTAGIVATATVLERHFGWKVGVPAYGVAAYVAASRLNENRHYLSDVIFGAAIGLAAGRTVTVGAGSTRFELSPMAAPGGVGVHVAVRRRP